jgi:hypothetical protein
MEGSPMFYGYYDFKIFGETFYFDLPLSFFLGPILQNSISTGKNFG